MLNHAVMSILMCDKHPDKELGMYCGDLGCVCCEHCHDNHTDGHRVLGRKNVENSGKDDKQRGNELEMYCGDLGCVCCHTCIHRNHRTCKQLQPDPNPNPEVEQYPSFLEKLGSTRINVTPSGRVCGLKVDEVPKQLTPPDNIYSAVNKQIYVKTSIDKKTCWVLGICQLPDGQTVIVDQTNMNVKLLSTSTYCILDELKLPRFSQDICFIPGTDLAVTVCEKRVNRYIRKEIQFISAVNGKLSHTWTDQIDHECFGIAYHNAQLYVGSKNAIYVYNQGKKIKLYEDTSGKYSTVKRFSISDDGSRIYIANYDKHLLLTLDSSGQQLSTFSDPELQRPTAVCVADDGSVLVCGFDSHNVLQVDKDGRRKMATLFTAEDGVYEPQSLFYDRKTNTLLVGQYNDNNLLALKLLLKEYEGNNVIINT